MSRELASVILWGVFEGTRDIDEMFDEALNVVGMTAKQFFAFRKAARSCDRRQPRFVLCTPTGSGRNR